LIRENPEIEFVIFASLWSNLVGVLQARTSRQASRMGTIDAREMQATMRKLPRWAASRPVHDIPVSRWSLSLRRRHRTRLWRNTARCARIRHSIPGKRSIQAGTTKVFEELARNNAGWFSLSLSEALCKAAMPRGHCP